LALHCTALHCTALHRAAWIHVLEYCLSLAAICMACCALEFHESFGKLVLTAAPRQHDAVRRATKRAHSHESIVGTLSIAPRHFRWTARFFKSHESESVIHLASSPSIIPPSRCSHGWIRFKANGGGRTRHAAHCPAPSAIPLLADQPPQSRNDMAQFHSQWLWL
jgi:hypothetical protein